MTKAPVKKTEKAEGKYKLSVTVNGETTKITTNDIHEALASFSMPVAIKTDVDIVVSSGKKETTHVVSVMKARRVFNNHTAVELLAVNLGRLID